MSSKIEKLVPDDFLKMIQEIKTSNKSNTLIMHQGAFGSDVDELLMLGASIKWANLNRVDVTIISGGDSPCEVF